MGKDRSSSIVLNRAVADDASGLTDVPDSQMLSAALHDGVKKLDIELSVDDWE
jgi:hypothetical protein